MNPRVPQAQLIRRVDERRRWDAIDNCSRNGNFTTGRRVPSLEILTGQPINAHRSVVVNSRRTDLGFGPRRHGPAGHALLRDLADAGRVVLVVARSLTHLDVFDQVLLLAPGKAAFTGRPTRSDPVLMMPSARQSGDARLDNIGVSESDWTLARQPVGIGYAQIDLAAEPLVENRSEPLIKGGTSPPR